MVNLYVLILVGATGLAGSMWVLDRLVWGPARLANAIKLQKRLGEKAPVVAQRPALLSIAAIMFPVFLVVLLARSFVFEIYSIPSESMMPNYKVGNTVLVKKFSYGLHEPLFHTRLFKIGSPERGEVVVFRLPDNPGINYIKRVVGVPGDRVIYKGKELLVKKAGSNTPEKADTGYDVMIDSAKADRAQSFFIQEGQPVGEWLVPEGHYFVIGDNRDNSQDSRFWGFVPDKNLVGQAVNKW